MLGEYGAGFYDFDRAPQTRFSVRFVAVGRIEMIKRGIQALAALMMFTASPAYSQVVLTENFDSGFGLFTPTGSVAVANGNAYIPC